MFFLPGSVIHNGFAVQKAGPLDAVHPVTAADLIDCCFQLSLLFFTGRFKKAKLSAAFVQNFAGPHTQQTQRAQIPAFLQKLAGIGIQHIGRVGRIRQIHLMGKGIKGPVLQLNTEILT